MDGSAEQTTTNSRSSPLAMWDMTVPHSTSDGYVEDDVKTFLRTHCKRWCFQLEKGSETDYFHFQVRMSLIVKKRVGHMITWISSLMPGCHVSPTSNPTFFSGNEFYVMKEDTRVDGPWTDRDDFNPVAVPTRLRNNTPDWRPWQNTVLSLINVPPNDREINVIYDPKGGNGKSFLTMWLMARNMAERIPQQKDPRDIMRMIMNLPKRSCYFIDLPRGTSRNNENTMYSAIEEIKNGYCYDDRYHFKREMFEPPHIWVFTNCPPNTDLLSRDRWHMWTISSNQHLLPWVPTVDVTPAVTPPLSLNIVRNNSTF